MRDEFTLKDLINKEIDCITVIEPIPYNMEESGVFFQDFGFIYWSTTQLYRDFTLKGYRKLLDDFKRSYIFSINLDDFEKYLKRLANEKTEDNINALKAVMESYLNLTLFTISFERKNLFISTFIDSLKPKRFRYWFYIGTMDLNRREITDKFNQVLDLAVKKKLGKKNCIVIRRQKTKT